MSKLIHILENMIRHIGAASSWLNVFLVILICVDVLQRYLFNVSHNWMIELEWHFFGLIFLFGSAYTLQYDKHVRVDVFYTNFSDKKKALVNLLGHTFLLIPWCIVAIVTCYNYASNSYYIGEGSPNPDGLPAFYIIKYCMVVAFLLLLVQGLVGIFNNIKTLSQ
jgi:TRAP-type mannitol/chloroaromatic compound transport system permease small subunit